MCCAASRMTTSSMSKTRSIPSPTPRRSRPSCCSPDLESLRKARPRLRQKRRRRATRKPDYEEFSHHRVRHALRHGKSNPPASWDGSEYQLTTARYTETIRAFCRTLKMDKPVVMGCSIGGRIVLNLAIDHADEFHALIGLEAADFQAPWYDTRPGSTRPDVHGGEVCAALVSGLIAPQSPDASGPENVMGLQAGRPMCLQGRSLFLSGRRRSARTGREDRY